MSAQPPESKKDRRLASLQQTLAELFEELTPLQVRAAYQATVPNWSDIQLLARLLSASPDSPASPADLELAQSAAAALLDLHLLRRDPYDRLIMTDDVRQALAGNMTGRELPAPGIDLRAAHRACLVYFSQRAAVATLVEQAVLDREIVYHQLALDEAAGLRLLDVRFEAAASAYQLAQAEALIDQASRLNASISEGGQAWMSYYRARLELLQQTGDLGKSVFDLLVKSSPGKTLPALARWNLGQLYVIQDDWSKAIQLYKESLDMLPAGHSVYRARLLYALGQAYRDLAENSGGFPDEIHGQYGRLNQALYRLQHMPFLLYEALRHRWDFLPNWYFGTNYQDWIIAYLFTEATRWYHAAVQGFEQSEGGPELIEARLALARMDHRLGRWPRAWKEYRQLQSAPIVSSSRYRLARIHMAQAISMMEEGRFGEAKSLLKDVPSVFKDFNDQVSLGVVYALDALLEEKLGRPEEAAVSYLDALKPLAKTGDNLTRTEVLGRLERLAMRSALSLEVRRQISIAVAQTEQFYYLARFPDQILRWFRRLALLGALPLSYLLVLIAGLAVVLALIVVEGSLRSFLVGVNISALPFTDFLILLAAVLLPVPFTLWIYRWVYSILGDILVWVLGRRLAPIEKEQPDVIVISKAGIEYRRSGTGQNNQSVDEEQKHILPWSMIKRVASVDYRLWLRPVQLISRTLVNPGAGALVVNGITAGYSQLQNLIARNLATQKEEIQRLDFTYLTRGWVISAALLSLVFTYLLRKLDISGGIDVELPLTFSTLALKFVTVLWLVFPTGVLVRLLRHRRMLEKTLGYQPEAVPTWVLLVALLFFVILLVGLVLLVFVVATLS
jgi:tetratricopeptide (TPR) repeat protein